MSQDPTDGPDPERLKRLEERLTEVRRTHEPAPRVDDQYSQANMAWRMVIELVSGLGIGFGIGYGLDAAFGTGPVFLVLFVLLGFAAGVRVMLRTATEIQTGRQAADAARDERE